MMTTDCAADGVLIWFDLNRSLSPRLDPLTLALAFTVHCVFVLSLSSFHPVLPKCNWSTLYWNEMRSESVTCFECIVAPTVWMFDCSASAHDSQSSALWMRSRSDFCERRAMVMVNGMLFTPYRFCVELLPLSVLYAVSRERVSMHCKCQCALLCYDVLSLSV